MNKILAAVAGLAVPRHPHRAGLDGERVQLRRVHAQVGDFGLRDISFEVPQGAYGIVIGLASKKSALFSQYSRADDTPVLVSQ